MTQASPPVTPQRPARRGTRTRRPQRRTALIMSIMIRPACGLRRAERVRSCAFIMSVAKDSGSGYRVLPHARGHE